MPPYNRRRLAAKLRMKKLRLRYPNGLWNKPVDLPVKEEEEQTGVKETFEETEINQVQTEDQVPTGLLEENLEEKQESLFKTETEKTETVPEEQVEETIEEIQLVQIGETFETSPLMFEYETGATNYEVPEIPIFSEELYSD